MNHSLKTILRSRAALVALAAAFANPAYAQVGITESVVPNTNLNTTTNAGVSVASPVATILPNGAVVRNNGTTSVNTSTGGTMAVDNGAAATTTNDQNHHHRHHGTSATGTAGNHFGTTNAAGISTNTGAGVSTNSAGVSAGGSVSVGGK